MDTIFATSSGSPPAAIAIIRVSGPRAFASVASLGASLPPLRSARVRSLRDPRDGGLLDRALVLAFERPRTATGEDIVEFHVHGGRAVVAAVEAALGTIANLRRAEPGEFTRRALTNGVIDLTEAEGLGDLLAAETEAQRRAALQIAEGGLRILVEEWTTRLVDVAAQVEALLDFAEEDQVEHVSLAPLAVIVAALATEISRILADPPVERIKDGVRVVLAGPPNSGKSTLLNALADRDVAIVSPISGTTRDRVDAAVVRNGIAYVLTDTAGLVDRTDDPIERIGVERARTAMADADVLLWLGEDRPPCDALWLRPRVDESGRAVSWEAERLAVSAKTGTGLLTLWTEIGARAGMVLPHRDVLPTNHRQRELLAAVRDALTGAAATFDPIVFAEEVRAALKGLDFIVGRAGVEAVLDALFARFCLGK